jgi:hypothetical protein
MRSEPVGEQSEIQQKLKFALDETRMSIMGVQILVGFQLQAIVQESFATLPWNSKLCIGGALILMVLTVGLLVSPAAQHRLVEDGNASARIVAVTSLLMEIALFAFAVGIALDVYVAVERTIGALWALGLGTAAFAAALLLWYAFALLYPARLRQEKVMRTENQETPLSIKIDYMLTEARVVLPGAQALLGFQLIAVLTKPFEQLPDELKIIHAVGLGMLTLSVMLLLAPAAFHRLAFKGEDAPPVHSVGSILVTAALAALAIGLGAAVTVAIGALTGRLELGLAVGSAILLVLLGPWYVWPLVSRARRHNHADKGLMAGSSAQ